MTSLVGEVGFWFGFFASYSNALPVIGGGVLRVERSGTRALKIFRLGFFVRAGNSLYDGHVARN